MKLTDFYIILSTYLLVGLCGIRDVLGNYNSINDYAARIGSTNVMEYANGQGRSDPYASTGDVNCGKVSYPNMFGVPLLVDEAVRSRTAYYVGNSREGSFAADYSILASSNRRGKLDALKASAPTSAYAMGFDNIEDEMYICAFREPPGEQNPDIIVDWLISFNGMGQPAKSKRMYFEAAQGTEVGCNTLGNRNNRVSILGISIIRPAFSEMFALEALAWVDAVSARDVKICVAWNNNPESGSVAASVNVTWAGLSGSETFNYGRRETGDYAVEYGSAELGIIQENGDSSWNLYCLDKAIEKDFPTSPLIFTTLGYLSKQGSSFNEPARHQWVEYVNEKGFRVCATSARYGAQIQPQESNVLSIYYLLMTYNGLYNERTARNLRDRVTAKIVWTFPAAYDWTTLQRTFPELVRPHSYYIYHLLHTAKRDSFGIEDDHNYLASYGYYFDAAERQIIGFVQMRESDMHDMEYYIEGAKNGLKMESNKLHARDEDTNWWFREVVDGIYPEHERTPENHLASVELTFHDGCFPNPYNVGPCSAGSCSEDSASGRTVLTRSYHGNNPVCSSQPVEAMCNLPPCSVTTNTVKLSVSKGNSPPLGVILGPVGAVVAVAVIAAIIYFKIKNSKVQTFKSRSSFNRSSTFTGSRYPNPVSKASSKASSKAAAKTAAKAPSSKNVPSKKVGGGVGALSGALKTPAKKPLMSKK